MWESGWQPFTVEPTTVEMVDRAKRQRNRYVPRSMKLRSQPHFVRRFRVLTRFAMCLGLAFVAIGCESSSSSSDDGSGSISVSADEAADRAATFRLDLGDLGEGWSPANTATEAATGTDDCFDMGPEPLASSGEDRFANLPTTDSGTLIVHETTIYRTADDARTVLASVGSKSTTKCILEDLRALGGDAELVAEEDLDIGDGGHLSTFEFEGTRTINDAVTPIPGTLTYVMSRLGTSISVVAVYSLLDQPRSDLATDALRTVVERASGSDNPES